MNIFGEHFVTCGQMKLLEKRADEEGLFYYQMMENAGTRAAEIILDKMAYKEAVKEDRLTESESVLVAEGLPSGGVAAPERPCALIFCGKGNNGGDGFVVARLLYKAGWHVMIMLIDGEPQTVDSRINYELLSALNVDIEVFGEDNGRLFTDMDIKPDIIVDAVYGTGFRGKLKGDGLKCASYINRRDKRIIVFSLDIPSGLGGDLIEMSEMERNSVKADYTIAFHAKKPVHLQKFAAEYCGNVVVADIGIDERRLMDADRF